MPKRATINPKEAAGLYQPTGAGQEQPEAAPDPVRSRGAGLKTSEWDHWHEIAQELGMKPHSLVLYVLRDFMHRYDAGQVETETKKRLKGL